MTEHLFAVSASFVVAEREGSLTNGDGTLDVRYTSAPSLGGKGGATNPEELLLSAIASCFSATWAIFIGKLKLPIAEAAIDVACEVEKDPEGGYRFARITVAPRVPADVWAARREDVTRSLELSEKYCIVSKAVTRGVSLHVELPE